MSAAVGAALKKVLVAILTEPKVLKNILFSILVVVVAMILPTVFVVSIFSGDFEVDTASLQQYVEDNTVFYGEVLGLYSAVLPVPCASCS